MKKVFANLFLLLAVKSSSFGQMNQIANLLSGIAVEMASHQTAGPKMKRTAQYPLVERAVLVEDNETLFPSAQREKDTCGTLLIFTNGDEVLCTVEEVGQTEISYVPCDHLSGPIRKTASDHVFMIQYLNGTKEIVTKLDARENRKEKTLTLENGSTFVPVIPKGVHPKNIDLITLKNGKEINCFIEQVSSKFISYSLLRHGKDPNFKVPVADVAMYVRHYKLTVLSP